MNDVINEILKLREEIKVELNDFSNDKKTELENLRINLEHNFNTMLEDKKNVLINFSSEQINSIKELGISTILNIENTATNKEEQIKLLEIELDNLLNNTSTNIEDLIDTSIINFNNEIEVSKDNVFQGIVNSINEFNEDIDSKCTDWLKQLEFSSNEGLRQLNKKENEAIVYIENAESTALENLRILKEQLEKDIRDKFNNINDSILVELNDSLVKLQEQTKISIKKITSEADNFKLEIENRFAIFDSEAKVLLEQQKYDFLAFIEEQKRYFLDFEDSIVADFNKKIDESLGRIDEKRQITLDEMSTAKDTHLATMNTAKNTHVATLESEYRDHSSALTREKTAHTTEMNTAKNTHLNTMTGAKDTHLATMNTAKNTHVATLESEYEEHSKVLTSEKVAHTTEMTNAKNTHLTTMIGAKDSHLATMNTAKNTHVATLESEYDKHSGALTSEKTAHTSEMNTAKNTHLATLVSAKDTHVATLESEYEGHSSALTREKTAHTTEMTNAKNTHLTTLIGAKDSHLATMNTAKNTHVATLESEYDKHSGALTSEKTAHTTEMNTAKNTHLTTMIGAKDGHLATMVSAKDGHLASLVSAKNTHVATLESEYEGHSGALTSEKTAHTTEMNTAKNTHLATMVSAKDGHLASLVSAKNTHVATLESEYEGHSGALTSEKTAHTTEMNTAKNTHLATMTGAKDGHLSTLTGAKDTHLATMVGAKNTHVATLESEYVHHSETLTDEKTAHTTEMANAKNTHLTTMINAKDGHLTTLTNHKNSLIGDFQDEYEVHSSALASEKTALSGQLTTLTEGKKTEITVHTDKEIDRIVGTGIENKLNSTDFIPKSYVEKLLGIPTWKETFERELKSFFDPRIVLFISGSSTGLIFWNENNEMPLKISGNKSLEECIFEETDDYIIYNDGQAVLIDRYATGTYEIYLERLKQLEGMKKMPNKYILNISNEVVINHELLLNEINDEQIIKLSEQANTLPLEEEYQPPILLPRTIPVPVDFACRVDKKTGEIYIGQGYENLASQTDMFSAVRNNDHTVNGVTYSKISNNIIKVLGTPTDNIFFNLNGYGENITTGVGEKIPKYSIMFNIVATQGDINSMSFANMGGANYTDVVQNIIKNDIQDNTWNLTVEGRQFTMINYPMSSLGGNGMPYINKNASSSPIDMILEVRNPIVVLSETIKPFVKTQMPSGKMSFLTSVTSETHSFIVKGIKRLVERVDKRVKFLFTSTERYMGEFKSINSKYQVMISNNYKYLFKTNGTGSEGVVGGITPSETREGIFSILPIVNTSDSLHMDTFSKLLIYKGNLTEVELKAENNKNLNLLESQRKYLDLEGLQVVTEHSKKIETEIDSTKTLVANLESTKFDKSSIVDNLESNSTTDGLSSRQGKVLAEMIKAVSGGSGTIDNLKEMAKNFGENIIEGTLLQNTTTISTGIKLFNPTLYIQGILINQNDYTVDKNTGIITLKYIWSSAYSSPYIIVDNCSFHIKFSFPTMDLLKLASTEFKSTIEIDDVIEIQGSTNANDGDHRLVICKSTQGTNGVEISSGKWLNEIPNTRIKTLTNTKMDKTGGTFTGTIIVPTASSVKDTGVGTVFLNMLGTDGSQKGWVGIGRTNDTSISLAKKNEDNLSELRLFENKATLNKPLEIEGMNIKNEILSINSEIDLLKKKCPYRIGDILTTENEEHPALTWVGTTWSKIENTFLRGTEASQSPGVVGGSNTVTLTTGNIPAHNHIVSVSLTTTGNHRHRVDNHVHSQPVHSHPFVASKDGGSVAMGGGSWLRSNQNLRTSNGGGENTGGSAPYTDYQGNHTHGVTASSSNTGSGQAVTIIPKYRTVFYWKRLT